MGFRNSSGGPARRAAAVVALAALLIMLAVALHGGEDRSAPRTAHAQPSEIVRSPTPGPTQTVAAWLDRTASAATVATAGRRKALIDDFVARGSQDRLAKQLQDAAAAFASDGGAGVEVRAVPLGYRVEAQTAREATVAAQQVVLRAAPDTATAGLLTTSRIRLVREDRWRVADASVEAVPFATVGATELAAGATRFTEYRHVP